MPADLSNLVAPSDPGRSKKAVYQARMRTLAADIVELAAIKGAQYWTDDPWQTYRAIGSQLNLTKEAVLLSLAAKHWTVLCRISRGDHQENVALTRERIMDVIVYLMNLSLMFQEKADAEARQEASNDPNKGNNGQ